MVGELISDHEMMALIRESLTEGLSAQRNRPVELREIQEVRDGGHVSSTFSVKRFRIVLDDRESLAVFFKDLNPMHQCAKARNVRRLELGRSRRELWMYREVLDSERLGTPQFYGHRWEPKRGLLWMLIEDVGHKRPDADFDLWLASVRWLAKFHAAMADSVDDDAGLLMRYDNAGFRDTAKQLIDNLHKIPAEQHHEIRQALYIYDAIIDSLEQQPWGLIHGEFFKHVMIRPGPLERQIAVIDWETAAYGPLYRDLADISSGQWTREQRLAMWRAYYDEYCRDSGQAISWQAFLRDVNNIAICQAIGWLSWSSTGNGRRVARRIARWTKELRRIMSEMHV